MIDINVIASGSKGNCYHLSDGTTELLLECGISWKKVQQSLKFKTSRIAGILISHEHADHSFGAIKAMEAGINIYLSSGTASKLKLSNYNVFIIKHGEQFEIGSWRIKPFNVVHDANEPVGFLLSNTSGDKLLFMTDSSYCKYFFKGITHAMLECNFDDEIVKKREAEKSIHPALVKRIRQSHFSISRVKDFLMASDTSRLESIYIIHLSDGNSDEKGFIADLQRTFGVPVFAY